MIIILFLNIVSVYATQIWCEEGQKEEFSQKMDEVMLEVKEIKNIIISGDGHVDSDRIC